MKALNRGDEQHGLRVAPLIDIIFLLLIFFMVTTTFHEAEKDITVTLADANEGSDRDESPTVLVVNVTKTGTIIVDQTRKTIAQLEEYIRSATEMHARIVVVVRCDKDARHKDFVRVLNLCEKVGVSGVAVATFDTGL